MNAVEVARAPGHGMMKINDIVTLEDLRLLTDIGFIAGARGAGDQANAIFAAIRILRPNQEAGFVGSAMVHIVAGDPDAAIKELKGAPATAATQTFLGIALLLSGSTFEGRETLQAVIESAPGTAFSKLAENTLR